MNRSRLLGLMASAPQEQLMASLERLMASRQIAASKARVVFLAVMSYRRSRIRSGLEHPTEAAVGRIRSA